MKPAPPVINTRFAIASSETCSPKGERVAKTFVPVGRYRNPRLPEHGPSIPRNGRGSWVPALERNAVPERFETQMGRDGCAHVRERGAASDRSGRNGSE